MKYKIRYRKYDKIRKKFVVIWFEDNDTQAPDFYINVDDVLTIERIGEEKEWKKK